MSDHPAAQSVTDIVLMSPNLQPRDDRSSWLTRPAGPFLARLIAGDTRSWTPYNEQQGRFWSTTYPIDAVVEVMRLVDYARARLPMKLEQNLLVLLAPGDSVVSAEVTRQAFERIDASRKQAD